jgi:hypothetical protein
MVLFAAKGQHQLDLRHSPCAPAVRGYRWVVALSSNDARFGGDGITGLDAGGERCALCGPETLVLRLQAAD